MAKRRCLILALALLASPAAAQVAAPAVNAAAQPAPSSADASARPASSALETAPMFGGDRRPGRATAATSRPAATPGLKTIGVDLGRMFLALAIVLSIIGGLYWLIRRFYGGAVSSTSTRAVKVLSRTPLAPRQQVMLLQVGRRVIVVGDSGGAMSPLAQIDDPDEVAMLLGQLQSEQMSRAASFGNVFYRNQKSFADADASATQPDAVGVPHDPADAGAEPAPPGDDPLAQQRSEIAGLLEKVRSLRGQIRP